MTPRRVTAWAAIAGILLLSAAMVTQLRPFWWDTHRVPHSIEAFERHRSLLMGGAWARIALLFPMVTLGIALPRLLDDDPLRVQLGRALAVISGGLSAVSGAVAVAIGVTAEEFALLDESSRAMAVAADSLYWVQDNLLTLSLIAFSAGLVAFASPLWRAGALPGWGRIAAQASIVLAAAIPLTFYVEASDLGPAAYAAVAFAAQAAILLCFGALARPQMWRR